MPIDDGYNGQSDGYKRQSGMTDEPVNQQSGKAEVPVYKHTTPAFGQEVFTEDQARRKQRKIEKRAKQKADKLANKVQMGPLWSGLMVFAVLASILGLFVYHVVFAGADKRGFWIGLSVAAVVALWGGYKMLASDGGGAQLVGRMFGK